jgi:CubicO group peptidase (beta-lactamase class C family)
MKTRVIQNESKEAMPPKPSPAPPSDPPRPTDLGGRMGRWSKRQRKFALWGIVAALVLGAAYLASKPGSDTPAANGAGTAPEFAAIERFVQEEMAAQRIPGLALGIVKDDRIAYMRGFG